MIEPADGNTYPAQLQKLLGDAYEVGNLDSSFGHSGTTVLNSGDLAYRTVPEFIESSDFNADKYVILLGTNDSKTFNWGPHAAEFAADYVDLVTHYQNLESRPTVYICLLPPIFHDGLYEMSVDNLENGVNPAIRRVASQTGAVLIDAHAPFLGHPEYFVDGVHPNAAGAKVLAQTVYQAIIAGR
jgi:sialate O-acetylesterase